MLVSREDLVLYNIPNDYFFASRNGTDLTARNFYFEHNPELLVAGIHCAVGNDAAGWELELFNGANWIIVNPNPNYLLTITNDGLKALTNVAAGGLKLTISGVKIISEVVIPNPATPIINWTDTDFLAAGNGKFVFTCGTRGSIHSNLSSILSWRFNDSSGSLQYILTLPPSGTGSTADDGSSSWKIGTVGLYVKSPDNGAEDILFGVGRLTAQATKEASTVKVLGNMIKFYLNTNLSNLGYVADVSVLESEEHSVPEVPNESLLDNPTDLTSYMYNFYLVDNLNGTGIPALAVPRTNVDHSITTSPTWAYFQPSDNFVPVKAELFDPAVMNYMFVYWDTDAGKYKPAVGSVERNTDPDVADKNAKLPIGLRIGNNIVFSGNITNDTTSYSYAVELSAGGAQYQEGDELLLCFGNQSSSPSVADDIVFKIKVTQISATGAIIDFDFLGPNAGNIDIGNDTVSVRAQYSPYSPLPRTGNGAIFLVYQTSLSRTNWNFQPSDLNKPVYIGDSSHAGMPVTSPVTNGFIGWCTGLNSIKLSLDLRNEASYASYGTTRYATDDEVKEVVSNPEASTQTAVAPRELNKNYLQITEPLNPNQNGSSQAKPITISSYTYFDKIILGKGTKSPYNDPNTNPQVTNPNLSFYGQAYAAMFQDIAEVYEADRHYDAGTLVTIGKGSAEMTIATTEANGVISDKPGFILGKMITDTQLPVALVGRTPVILDGNCIAKYGDKIYLSKVIPGTASTIKNGPCIGKIIQRNVTSGDRRVECIVRLALD